ncbi:MAG: response regulator [Pirellulales bacterium]|nr:response regulator [Pirellulales bacterium]
MTREKIIGRPMEILLVEDDWEDAGITIEALRTSEVPFRVSLVRSGEEALEFLHRRRLFRRAPRPDLILLDLQLPQKSGRDVLAEVKAHPELRSIPVVVLTASRVHQTMLQDEGLDVESYLTKPVDLPNFYGVIRGLRKFMLSDVILPQ